MICVKCYREQLAKQDRSSSAVVQMLHADVVFNGMSLCMGHLNRELNG